MAIEGFPVASRKILKAPVGPNSLLALKDCAEAGFSEPILHEFLKPVVLQDTGCLVSGTIQD